MLAHAQPLLLHLPHVIVLILWVVHLLQLQESSERQEVLRGPGYAPSQANLTTPPHTENFNSHQSLGYPATPGSLFLPQGLLGVVVFPLIPHPGGPAGTLRILRGHVVDMGILFTHGLQDAHLLGEEGLQLLLIQDTIAVDI